MEGRFVRERHAVQNRQKKRAGGPHFADHFGVLGLVPDEKIALKRRDPGRECGDDERDEKSARRKAQLSDYTPLRGQEKTPGTGVESLPWIFEGGEKGCRIGSQTFNRFSAPRMQSFGSGS